MKIFIASPCLNYICSTNYTYSLIKTIELLIKLNIEYIINFNNNLITPLSRDIITNNFLNSDCTHLFFIDTDISWDPNDFMKIITNCKDILGGCYPFKQYYFEKFSSAFTISNLKYKLINYVAQKNENQDNITNIDIVNCKNLGTGFMCIDKHVFLNLADKCKKYKYNDIDMVNYFALTYNDIYLPEDYNFCKLVNDNNMFVQADISVNLTHEGVNVIQGNVKLSSL